MEKDKQTKKDKQKQKEPKVVYVSREEAPNLQRFYELAKKKSGKIVQVTVTRRP